MRFRPAQRVFARCKLPCSASALPEHGGPDNNWRAAVESTLRSVPHPFGGQAGKLPVRGQVRVTQILIYSALMVNVRQIWRHEQQLAQKGQEVASFLSLCCFRLRTWFHTLNLQFPRFGSCADLDVSYFRRVLSRLSSSQ